MLAKVEADDLHGWLVSSRAVWPILKPHFQGLCSSPCTVVFITTKLKRPAFNFTVTMAWMRYVPLVLCMHHNLIFAQPSRHCPNLLGNGMALILSRGGPNTPVHAPSRPGHQDQSPRNLTPIHRPRPQSIPTRMTTTASIPLVQRHRPRWLVCLGFPCQSCSICGLRALKSDDRVILGLRFFYLFRSRWGRYIALRLRYSLARNPVARSKGFRPSALSLAKWAAEEDPEEYDVDDDFMRSASDGEETPLTPNYRATFAASRYGSAGHGI
jgi:hypothetical protein